MLAVSGVKNSGKTALLVRLLPLLNARGLSVAVIKHDGHDFEPDVPGTDSHRLRKAGARTVGIYSDKRFMLTAEGTGAALEDMIALAGAHDLILVEGAKSSPYPKIEIVRGAVSRNSVCDPKTLLALVTDTDLKIPGLPSIGLDDYEALAGLILDCLSSYTERSGAHND